MKPLNVLVLDDEQNILNALKRLLRGEPFDVFTTSDWKTALDTIEKEEIKVVMSDQRMPSVSGVEFLCKVKESHPETIRILFTGHADIEAAENAINKGEVYRFINKPWDDFDMRATIRDAIKQYDLVQQNKQLFKKIQQQNEELQLKNIQLNHLYKRQRDFTSTVSHELRTPLGSIKMAFDIIEKRSAGTLGEESAHCLKLGKKNVDRLARLINDILDLEKLESGREEMGMQLADLNEIIREVSDIQKPAAEQKGLTLKTELDSSLEKIMMNPDKMNQVLSNLVSNAVKFTDRGGVTVSSRRGTENGHIEMLVSDTGMGIAERDKSKLFKKFQQLGHASEHVGGTGLGLAICKEIVERHGGKIEVTSVEGKGASFIVRLPVSKEKGAAGHAG